MRHMLLFGNGHYRHANFSALMMRQGLPPVNEDSIKGSFSAANWTGSAQEYIPNPSISKNKKWIVSCTGNPGAANAHFNLWEYINQDIGFDRKGLPPNQFAGSPYAAAVSNDYVVVGGTTPFIQAWNLIDNSVVPLSNKGLGVVYQLLFSLDERYLFVFHGSAPYLRRYDTLDLSYVDAPANSSGTNLNMIACLTGNGKKIVVFCASNTTICVFDVNTMNRDFVSGSVTAMGVSRGISYKPNAIPHPVIPTAVLRTGGDPENSRIVLGMFDTATNTYSSVWGGVNLGTNGLLLYDRENHEIIIGHNNINYRSVTILDAGDFTEKPSKNSFLNFAIANNVAIGACIFENGVFRMTGTVRDISNNPAARVVRAHRRSDGLLCGQTVSDAATGNYELILPDSGPYDLQFMTADGDLLNDLLYARSEPELIA